MLCAERLRLHYTPRDVPRLVLATARPPTLLPRAAGGLSGRPKCRIFPAGRVWVLQVEVATGWVHGPIEPPPRLTFPTLKAAVSFAEQHGYDYRIIIPSSVASIVEGTNPRGGTSTVIRLEKGQNNKEN